MASNQYTVRILILVLALINLKLQNSIRASLGEDVSVSLHNSLLSPWVIILALFLGLFGSVAMSLTVFQR